MYCASLTIQREDRLLSPVDFEFKFSESLPYLKRWIGAKMKVNERICHGVIFNEPFDVENMNAVWIKNAEWQYAPLEFYQWLIGLGKVA